jgi:hypothetical protein
MDILQLPAEIQLAIVHEMDYKSLHALSATNRYFRDIVLDNDKQLLKLALLDVEENSSTAWRTELSNDRSNSFLPCYDCHKLLLHCYFTSGDWYSTSTRSGPHAFKRRCMTCQYRDKHKYTRSSRVLRPGRDDKGGLWVYCAGCKLVTHTAPLALCGFWDHAGPVSYVGQVPIVPKDFRCVLCYAKRHQHSDAKKQTVRARNTEINLAYRSQLKR